MFQTGFLIVCIISLSFVSLPAPIKAQATDRFMVTDLGTLGGANSFAYGINDQGWVVGDAQTSTGQYHAFIWKDGVMTDLFAGCDSCGISHAQALNNVGQVVGWAYKLPGGTDSYVGFIWQDGQFTDMGQMPGFEGLPPQPYGINDQGDVVGGVAAGAENIPFIYRSGQWTQIGPSDMIYGTATGINNAGQVTGYLSDSVCGFPGTHCQAFRYNERDGTLQLIPVSFAQTNKGVAIQANGDVVGFAFTGTSGTPPTTAVLWHKDSDGSDWVAKNILAGVPGAITPGQ